MPYFADFFIMDLAQLYMNFLDITSFTQFDTALCNKELRPYFLRSCQYYTTNEIFTTIEFHKYAYSRKINITNLMIFNNEQLSQFIESQFIESQFIESQFIESQTKCLSISDCCIDNILIHNILSKFKKLEILRLGISKFTNGRLDVKNIYKYKLVNIYSTWYLHDKFVYLLGDIKYEYDIKDVKNNFMTVKQQSDSNINYLNIHHNNKHDSITAIRDDPKVSFGVIPIKYYNSFCRKIYLNIMNNIIGDIYFPDKKLPLKELYIHNAHNLKYYNIVPLLENANVEILSLRINTNESFYPLLQFNIKQIELVNSKLKYVEILKYAKMVKDRIFALELNYNSIKRKMNIIMHLYDAQIMHLDDVQISFTICDNHIILQQLLTICKNISELTIYIHEFNVYFMERIKLCDKPPKLNKLIIYYDNEIISYENEKMDYCFK